MLFLLAANTGASCELHGNSSVVYHREWEDISDAHRQRLCSEESVEHLRVGNNAYSAPSGYRPDELARAFQRTLCPSGLPRDSPIGPLDATDVVDFCRAERLVVGTAARSFLGAYVQDPKVVSGTFGPERIVLDASLRGDVLVAVERPRGFWAAPLTTRWALDLPGPASPEEIRILHDELCNP